MNDDETFSLHVHPYVTGISIQFKYFLQNSNSVKQLSFMRRSATKTLRRSILARATFKYEQAIIFCAVLVDK